MSEKLIISILLVVYLARPKKPDEIQISGEMDSGCFYCMYEVPDHKVGIYCNVIGPLAELHHSAFSCKKVLRYFGKVRHQSNVRIIKYDWLIVL